LASLVSVALWCHGADSQPIDTLPALQQKAVSVLRAAIREGKHFEKVHAAEALIWSGKSDGVREYFLQQDRAANSEPIYRIGVWRVLYRVNAGRPAEEQKYFRKIMAVFSDAKASDRGTAAETLAKLKYAGRTELVLDLAAHGKDDIRGSARWILANSGKTEDEAYLAEMLGPQNPKDCAYAAYAVRHLKTVRPATLKALQALVAEGLADDDLRCYALGTLYTHLPAEQRKSVKPGLLKYATAGNTEQRYQACMALANWPTQDMIAVVEKLLASKQPDERIGAARVLLRMSLPDGTADFH
jgi:hypothetical protein